MTPQEYRATLNRKEFYNHFFKVLVWYGRCRFHAFMTRTFVFMACNFIPPATALQMLEGTLFNTERLMEEGYEKFYVRRQDDE